MGEGWREPERSSGPSLPPSLPTSLPASTMAALAQKQVKVSNMKILDTNMIFARGMTLQCSQRNYDTKHLMAHELARRPASMFDDRARAMKVANLTVDLSRRRA